MWVDTHCHWDAPEFGADAARCREQAAASGVNLCVVPAVAPSNWAAVAQWAHAHNDVYALGIHPLFAEQADMNNVLALEQALTAARNDPRLVAVGEIGLDAWVPSQRTPQAQAHQRRLFEAQLELARQHDLPVIVHARQANDLVLVALRRVGVRRGIAHAFSGSVQQAQALWAQGLHLGAGGTATFEAARRLHRALAELPPEAWVMETDAPDIPPQWLYVPRARREAGEAQGVNSPAQLPRIGHVVAQRLGLSEIAWRTLSTANAQRALPGLAAWLGNG